MDSLINKKILELGSKKEEVDDLTWKAIAQQVNEEFGATLTGNAARKRFARREGRDEDESVGLDSVPLNQVDEAWVESYLIEMGLNPNHYEFEPVKIWGDAYNPRASLRVVPKAPQGPDLEQMVEYIARSIKHSPPKYEEPLVERGLMAVFSLYDPHMAKISSRDGVELTDEIYKEVLADLIGQVVMREESRVQKAALVVGQDWTNFDNRRGETTLGTPQDNSMTFNQMVEQQVATLLWSVDHLVEHFGHVELHFVPGNHDKESNFWLYTLASNLYKDHDNISVLGGKKWSVIRWGEVGILSIHADTGKTPDYVKVWSTSDRASWAFTTYKEIHTGHLHTRKKRVSRDMGDWYEHDVESEDRGILTRFMPGLAATDDWHEDNLYVNNHRLGLVTVYSEKRPTAEYYSYVT